MRSLVKIESFDPLPKKSSSLLHEVGVAMSKHVAVRAEIIRKLRDFAAKAKKIYDVDKKASIALGVLSAFGSGVGVAGGIVAVAASGGVAGIALFGVSLGLGLVGGFGKLASNVTASFKEKKLVKELKELLDKEAHCAKKVIRAVDAISKDASFSKARIGLTLLLDSIAPGLKRFFSVVGGDGLTKMVLGFVSGKTSVVAREVAKNIVKGAAVIPKNVGSAVGEGIVSTEAKVAASTASKVAGSFAIVLGVISLAFESYSVYKTITKKTSFLATELDGMADALEQNLLEGTSEE